MSRKVAQAGISLIKSFEGCRLTAYKPVATETHYTIGWGHYGADVKQGMTITQAQADEMFLRDIVRYEEPVNDLNLQLNQNQFDALVSFCYNCGAGNLRTLCLGRTTEQIVANMPAYNKGGGQVLAGLVRRRTAEVELFNKEDESMTNEEKKAFEALQQKVQEQADHIAKLESQRNMDAPEWAKEAAAHYAPFMATKTGSYDFWRAMTIQYRVEKGLRV